MTTFDEQLTKYLTDAHSIEEQALVQMRGAPKLAGDPEIAAAFELHLGETEGHESLVRRRLEARGASPAMLKDLAGKVTGQGFALFAQFQPDTPGKLVTHAYSYEHMELAAYDLLSRVAALAGDTETEEAAQQIRAQEQAMSMRLEGLFDRAVEASLREQDPDNLPEQLISYLTDAHAIESQAIQLLEKGTGMAGSTQFAEALEEHLAETREHERLTASALEARGASPSKLKDATLRLGALNWGMFFQAQPDTPAKLAGFAYAFEHLEDRRLRAAGAYVASGRRHRARDDRTEDPRRGARRCRHAARDLPGSSRRLAGSAGRRRSVSWHAGSRVTKSAGGLAHTSRPHGEPCSKPRARGRHQVWLPINSVRPRAATCRRLRARRAANGPSPSSRARPARPSAVKERRRPRESAGPPAGPEAAPAR